ncbi:AAA15 family ATPase/GTPase [Herbaspirillum sp. Sphag1AN]|uniref:AAA family ATPase n=1 Tax=unclassified Herbaspirillum TaxID=2624150 RepID=UPI001609A227|nr:MULTISPECIES: AAA family ATPase [unclassified Herbaspirillum]MBB3212578.1 AAA15 family ATPase/GTPase [Herbaspirillum sp. Sphag1AN]MBB3245775.1 AAA15 family ATPase/GTPase [Herbaspirillum sp. Sphag64]
MGYIAKSKKELGYTDNKEIQIELIKAIEIGRFRSFSNRTVELGSHITVLVGRNGSMKTSLMGLIAHPFSSESKDAFGRELKTTLKEVFKLSEIYDRNDYSYNLIVKTTKEEELLKEEVKIYYVANSTNRHRVVMSGAEKGDGNFSYNTSFLNLKRLLPLVDTKARPDMGEEFSLTERERAEQKNFYEFVLPSTDYGVFAPIHQKGQKTTFAPTGENARYDYESISSGEDNLGAIFNKLIGFQRAFPKTGNVGNGIFCIDEFESSLHPVAQLNLFRYLYDWSARYRVQIVITTHSLHLIQDIYLNHKHNLDSKRVVINFVSGSSAAEDRNYPIIVNPEYQLAYQELTLVRPEDVAESQKIDVFCEDPIAIHYVKRLIKSSEVLKLVSFHSNLNQETSNEGTPYSSLASLCKNFSLLLKNSFVIFDADVPEGVTKAIKDKGTFMLVPDADKLALERRIICFILGLPNDHEFFLRFRREKTAILNDMKRAGVSSLTIADVMDEKKVAIGQCKKWVERHEADFKKYVTYYCAQLGEREIFVKMFVERINLINTRKGLPLVAA